MLRLFRLFDGREIGISEEAALGIFSADDGEFAELIERPGDVEGGIIPDDTAFAGWVVEVGGAVEDLGGLGQDEEAVSEAFGDPEELKRLCGARWTEMKASEFTEIRGVFS